MARAVTTVKHVEAIATHTAGPEDFVRAQYARTLHQAMQKKGLSQADLARKVDMGRDSINTYIKGRTMPSVATQEKLARALGMRPEELCPQISEKKDIDILPALEIRQSISNPDKAWLRVNQEVPIGVAAQVIAILQKPA